MSNVQKIWQKEFAVQIHSSKLGLDHQADFDSLLCDSSCWGELNTLNLCATRGFIWIHSLASRWKVQIFWNWSFHFSSSIWLQFHWKPTIFSNNECAGGDNIIQYAESVVMHINFKSNWKWFIIVIFCKLSLRVNLAASLNSWNVEGPNLPGGCDKTRAPRPSQLYLGSGLSLEPRVAAYRWNHG